MKRKGVFLTLGITFVSVIILTLASLILRNAESSEERITELASFDRLYNLDRSLGKVYKEILLNITNFNITINESFIKVDKFFTANESVSDLDRTIIDVLFALFYSHTIYEGFTYILSTVTNEYIWLNFDYPSMSLLYYQIKAGNATNPNNPFGVTGINKILALLTNTKLVRNYTIIVKHDSLNGTINWTVYTPEPNPCDNAYNNTIGCGHTLNVTVLGPGGWVNSSMRMINITSPQNELLSQAIHIIGYGTNINNTPLLGLSSGGFFSGYVAYGVVNYQNNLTVTLIIDYYPDKKIKLGLFGEIITIDIAPLGVKKYGPIRIF